MNPLIAPSMLSADFGRLAEDIRAVADAGADWIHVDIMDGRFVPNITIGPPVVAAVRAATTLPLDVHLMIVEPERYLGAFVEAGADYLTVHVETCPHLSRTLAEIRRLGAYAGAALNPSTPPAQLRYVVNELDLVVCMSVNPGFGGQSFIPATLDKVRETRALLNDTGRGDALIEVDGGVDPGNAAALAAAGCQVFVAGTAVFGAPRYDHAVTAIREAALKATTGAER